jgi:hypothetical protein
VQIDAWRVHDTGLVAAPGPYRRLPGAVRHHQGRGDAWPDRVRLEVTDDALVVADVGSWPLGVVTVDVLAAGPPVTFVVVLPDAAHLLAAPADDATTAWLARFTVGPNVPCADPPTRGTT